VEAAPMAFGCADAECFISVLQKTVFHRIDFPASRHFIMAIVGPTQIRGSPTPQSICQSQSPPIERIST
jgi:hypothetical protein